MSRVEPGAGGANDWADRAAAKWCESRKPSWAWLNEGDVHSLADLLREVACTCPEASTIVRPELEEGEDG